MKFTCLEGLIDSQKTKLFNTMYKRLKKETNIQLSISQLEVAIVRAIRDYSELNSQDEFLQYNNLNETTKKWIKKYAVAYLFRTIGLSIRVKYSNQDKSYNDISDMFLKKSEKEINKLKKQLIKL